MITQIFAAVALCASVGCSVAAESETTVSAAGVTLKSVSVTFPESDRRFPGGANAKAINSNCLICHSSGMVLYQPRLSPTAWGEEVAKMRKTYGAPAPDESVAAIVDYLSGLDPQD
ncbi:cytochrome c [Methylocella tundrae]|uniref:Cytochrome c oxidoreductase subunit b n=1 Tax=Methylocella tundrae TaxID=227605 RepID=A0A4U8Z3X4_METTU|nr:cytochrome c [Methylocella tundrae]WPP03897.1 cytochrome c [Methylocella tundrae]VFU10099.1 Cytochrome c oxidoreductase subunit b [Methylocella tundrae]